MKFNIGLFLSALSSISALDLLPNHAPPEVLAISNVTVMIPRVRNSGLEKQIFNFGSAQTGFSGRILGRQQSNCSTGYGECPNDPGYCCPLGGRCCGDSKCCDTGYWCYGGGCCSNSQNGCDDQGCCAKGEQCCKGGSCCKSGYNCVIIDGKLGCCPIGDTCTGPPTCQDTGYSLCPDEKSCCPTGYICYRDAAGNAKCRNPDPPPEPDTTTIVIQTTQVVTQTYQVTQTPLQTRTLQPSSLSPSRVTSSTTTSQTVQTGAVLGSETKTNIGAIAGGAAAGVVAIVLSVLAIITWHHQQTNGIPTTGPQPDYPPITPYPNAGAAPPTPSSGDPFHSPMVQHQDLGVPHFNGPPAPSSPAPTALSDSNSGTSPYNPSHYSGLPELQQNAMSGPAMPTPAMPRYDSSRPHSLPMSVAHSQQPQTPIVRPWSGFAPPSEVNPAPYAENNNSQPSGWAAPTDDGWESPPRPRNASPPYAGQSGSGAAVRPLPTTYQSSSHVAHSSPGSPSKLPPLPEVHSGMAAGGSGGGDGVLPVGTPPPMDLYGPEEKRAYVRYQ